MDPNAPQIPNLSAVLQTLSAYASPQVANQREPSDLEDGEYDPSQYQPSQYDPALAVKIQSESSGIRPGADLPLSTTPPPILTSGPTATKITASPSPTGIITWPRALSYTIQNILCNPNKKQRIQHLIQTQKSHERQWWASREDLIRKALSREKSRTELDNVLASVGGLVAKSTNLQGEAKGDEIAKELANFDRKVYRACREMVDASKKELWELGVPFFCAGASEKIEKDKLKALRKRMLDLLEDYCNSEVDL